MLYSIKKNITLYFFHWFALHFQDFTYAKNLVFVATSARDRKDSNFT